MSREKPICLSLLRNRPSGIVSARVTPYTESMIRQKSIRAFVVGKDNFQLCDLKSFSKTLRRSGVRQDTQGCKSRRLSRKTEMAIKEYYF
jgi:hypothetical protein